MKQNHWNVWVTIGLVASALLVAAFNYVVDPYGVFGSEFLRAGSSTNERFKKVEHILSTKGKYTSFILGSSVMGAFEPSWLEAKRPGSAFYNASFLGGLPSDALKLLKLMKAEGVRVEEIYMGIDLFPFMQAEDSKSPAKQHHYLITGEPKSVFFADYLFASSFWHGFQKARGSFDSTPFARFDIDGTGRYYLEKHDAEIKKDHPAFVKKQFGSKKVAGAEVGKVVWIESRFGELKELVEWTKENNIKATYFIHPFHRLIGGYIPSSSMEEFRARIFSITGDIPDFTGDRSITDDDYRYYDPKHYLPSVAREIVGKSFF